ncbi:MAG: hypothetical protein U0941_08895 [Planctomycetaceae bacterium]
MRAPISRRVIDLFAAVIVVVFALDTLPCTPGFVRNGLEPFLDGAGLWQGTWSLFAPIPDSRNHRLRADLHYADGTYEVWMSPDWRSQSSWKRFIGHRESEFLEKISDEVNQPAWSNFASSVARQEGLRLKSRQMPEKILLSVMWEDISPPKGDIWNPAAMPVNDWQDGVFYTWHRIIEN